MADKKILWVFPKNTANVLVGSLIVTVILSVIWSYIEGASFSDNKVVHLIEWLLLAALIGWAVGMFAGNANTLTLWIAAGFAVVGSIITKSAIEGDGSVLDRIIPPIETEAFTLSVSIGAIILGIVAASFATWGSKSKM